MMDTGETRKKIHSRNSMVAGLRAIMLFIVFMLSVSFFISVFYIVTKERRENNIRESITTLDSLSESISSDIERYKEISRLVMMDEGFVKYLKDTGNPVDAVLLSRTRSSIMRVLNPTTMVDSVFGFRDDENYVVSNRDRYVMNFDIIDSPEWKEELEEKKGGAVISVNAGGAIVRAVGRPLVSIGRVVYEVNTQQRVGIMVMNISSSFIDGKLRPMYDREIAVVGSDGTLLSGNADLVQYLSDMEITDMVAFKSVKDGRGKAMLSARKIPNLPIYIVCLMPEDNGFVMYRTIYVLIFLVVIFALSIVIAGTYITRNVTNPVTELTDAMEKNKQKGTLEKIDIDIPQNEIGVLKESYNGMVERVNELYSQNLDKEQVIRRAEMRVLHEQIKPHFLYNSIETIGSMAMDAGAADVHSALETLGSFFRNFLSKGDREIPLSREINIVKDYLRLQKLRYGDIIEDEYDIAEDTERYIIPKLILQPIVENSIYHGIRLTGEPGTISIKSRLIDDVLHLYIRDTGVGMTEEQIEKLLAAHDKEKVSEEPAPSESFGLWGTIERIRYFCGTSDVVKIRSTVGEFTEIEFIIPKRGRADER